MTTTTTGALPRYDVKRIPEELKARDRWVCFSIIPQSKGTPKKTPLIAGIRPLPGVKTRAEVDDPSTWRPFAVALRDAEARGLSLAFAFGPELPYFFLDTDDVLDDEGFIRPDIAELGEHLTTYTEWSTSRAGLHIIGRGAFPERSANRPVPAGCHAIERYPLRGGRFCIFTGDVLPGFETIEERGEQLGALFPSRPAHHTSGSTASPGSQGAAGPLTADESDAIIAWAAPFWTDGRRHHLALYLSGALARKGVARAQAVAIIERCAAGDSDPGAKINACHDSYDSLKAGESVSGWYGLKDICGLSDEDLAPLATILDRFWARALGAQGFGADPTAQSGTAEPQQTPSGGDAAEGHQDAGKTEPPSPRLVVQPLASVVPQAVIWLWLKMLALGKFHLLGGYAGDGKSTLIAALAAIGSRGGMWPDGTRPPRPFRTLFLLGEDAADDTLRPRLELHDADMDQIFAIETVLDERGQERFFNIARHLDLLDAAVVEYGIDWIVIDPLTTIMPGTDRNAEGDTRDALTPLIKLANRRNVAITGIAHVGKSTGTNRRAMQRILGATAFHALARVVWMIAPDEDDHMVLGVVKSNLAIKPPSLLWSREEDGPIRWEGVAAQDIEDLLSSAAPATPRADAEGFLRDYLASGSRRAAEVEQAAKARGISNATLRRASDAIPVKKWKATGPNGAWFWSLPDGTPWNLLTPEQGEQVPSEGAQSNLLTSIDAQVSKLSKFQSESNLLTCDEGEHLLTTRPNSTPNRDTSPDANIMEGAQLAHPQILRGEQVTSDNLLTGARSEQVPSGSAPDPIIDAEYVEFVV